MEMEVVLPLPVPVPVPVLVPIPGPAGDFNFDSTCSTPYISAPSSPQRFGTGIGTCIGTGTGTGTGTGSGNFFYSAPTSPTHAAVLYNQFKDLNSPSTSANFSSLSSAIPFDWEETPGTPKVSASKSGKFDDGEDEYDFAFDFSGQLERPSLSADELFDGGKIKPLKPPPRLQIINSGFGDSESEINDFRTANSSPRSPMKKIFKDAFSPRRKRSDFDPFEEAMKETRGEEGKDDESQHQRGRERNPSTIAAAATESPSSSSSKNFVRRKKTRSLSPFRVSDVLYGHEEIAQIDATTATPTKNSSSTSSSSSSSSSFFSSFSFSRAYRKWKLKDLLLFRSASEGRPTAKELLNNYDILSKKSEETTSKESLNKYVTTSFRKNNEDVRNSSFRSTDSTGSSVSSSRRRLSGMPPLSAHELHYTVNRAVSEEMRRKTFLPYKQGLLGCLGFNPTVHEASIRGVGSMPRG